MSLRKSPLREPIKVVSNGSRGWKYIVLYQQRNDGFAARAYQLLITEKLKPAKSVAAALGIKYPALHARLIGRTPFRPDEITALIAETRDVRLVDRLLDGTPFMAVNRPEAPSNGTRHHLLHDAVAAVSASVSLLRETEEALKSGPIDRDERARIEAQINDAARTLETLRRHLPLV